MSCLRSQDETFWHLPSAGISGPRVLWASHSCVHACGRPSVLGSPETPWFRCPFFSCDLHQGEASDFQFHPVLKKQRKECGRSVGNKTWTFGSVRLLKDDPEPWQKAARAVLAYSVPRTTVGPRDVLCVSEVICTGELLLRWRLDWLPERCRRRGRVKMVKEHWARGIRERNWETGMWEARCSQCRAVHRPALLPFWWDEYQPVPFSDRPSQQQSKANQHN